MRNALQGAQQAIRRHRLAESNAPTIANAVAVQTANMAQRQTVSAAAACSARSVTNAGPVRRVLKLKQ